MMTTLKFWPLVARRMALLGLLALPAALGSATMAVAQYDRDGRYVPSPMGVPSDPTRPAIPLSSGTPGVPALGQPSGLPLAPLPMPKTLSPRDSDPLRPRLLDPRTIGISIKACERGWTRHSGLPRRIFEARCARLGN